MGELDAMSSVAEIVSAGSERGSADAVVIGVWFSSAGDANGWRTQRQNWTRRTTIAPERSDVAFLTSNPEIFCRV